MFRTKINKILKKYELNLNSILEICIFYVKINERY